MFSLHDLQLTKNDVERLMKEPSANARAETAIKVSYQIDQAEINDDERRLAHEVLRLMAGDAALQVRQAIVESLKASHFLPHDIALKLVADLEVISLPLLELTPVLTDRDLINIVQMGSAAKQAAIARRPSVSTDLASTLAQKAACEAIETLILNDGADVTVESFHSMLDRFEARGDVAYNMAHRQIIPASILERLVNNASDEIRGILMRRADLPDHLAQALATEARERTVIQLLQRNRSDAETVQLIQQLKDNHRLNPSLVLRAICAGDIQFFEVTLAVIARIPISNARVLVQDKGRAGLNSIYQKSGLPLSFLPAVRHALAMALEDRGGTDETEEMRHQRLLERIWADPQSMSQDDIDHFFSKLAGIRALSS